MHPPGQLTTEISDYEKEIRFYPDPGRKVFSLYAKQNIPRNFLVDKDGKIAVSSTGFTDKEFKETIKKVESLFK